MEPAVMTRHATLVLGLAAGLLCLFHAPAARAQAGALSQPAGTDACVSDDGSGGACADGNALAGAQGVAVSSDGKNVYVASTSSGGGPGAVVVFARQKK
jgi:DNA-binding beta-propeller fold protein YncE